jgi:hypothetical protein
VAAQDIVKRCMKKRAAFPRGFPLVATAIPALLAKTWTTSIIAMRYLHTEYICDSPWQDHGLSTRFAQTVPSLPERLLLFGLIRCFRDSLVTRLHHSLAAAVGMPTRRYLLSFSAPSCLCL